jgi:hypothetical protein
MIGQGTDGKPGWVRVKDFHELKVWQKAHALTLAVYQSTTDFPREELYGLTSQLCRIAVLVSSRQASRPVTKGDLTSVISQNAFRLHWSRQPTRPKGSVPEVATQRPRPPHLRAIGSSRIGPKYEAERYGRESDFESQKPRRSKEE